MVFYLPLIIMVAIISMFGIFDFFSIPQRFCEVTRVFQLMFTSHFWYDASILTFLVVMTIALQ